MGCGVRLEKLIFGLLHKKVGHSIKMRGWGDRETKEFWNAECGIQI